LGKCLGTETNAHSRKGRIMSKLNTAFALGTLIGATKCLRMPGTYKEFREKQLDRLAKLVEEIDRRGTSRFAEDADSMILELDRVKQ